MPDTVAELTELNTAFAKAELTADVEFFRCYLGWSAISPRQWNGCRQGYVPQGRRRSREHERANRRAAD
jgi:hypothetical protein